MKRTISLLLSACVLSAHPCFGAYSVEISAGRIFGLSCFMNSLAGLRYGHPLLKQVFEKSRFNDEKHRALIDEYRKIYSDNIVPRGFRYKKYPSERSDMIWNAERFLLLQSSKSENLRDFENQIESILPYSENKLFFEILKTFEPVYDEVVWQPNNKKASEYRRKLLEKLNSGDFAGLLRKAGIFYKADFAEDEALRVVLHPIPTRETNARVIVVDNTVLLPVPTDGDNQELMFGVILHEFCHALGSTQNAEFQQNMVKLFLEGLTPSQAESAVDWFGEGLATAIGNGWSYKIVTGMDNKGNWYNDAKVDAFAKALYPEVTNYLENGKSLDPDFIAFAKKRYVEIFK